MRAHGRGFTPGSMPWLWCADDDTVSYLQLWCFPRCARLSQSGTAFAYIDYLESSLEKTAGQSVVGASADGSLFMQALLLSSAYLGGNRGSSESVDKTEQTLVLVLLHS